MTLRELALRYAWTWLGRPYVWGGDDPSGIDCSGLVVELLAGVGLVPNGWDATAQGIFDRFRAYQVADPKPGCLVFYQKGGLMTHVGVVLEELIVLQAGGGGSATVDPAAAWKQNAFVKLRPIDYRPEGRFYVDPFSGK